MSEIRSRFPLRVPDARRRVVSRKRGAAWHLYVNTINVDNLPAMTVVLRHCHIRGGGEMCVAFNPSTGFIVGFYKTAEQAIRVLRREDCNPVWTN